MVYYSRPSLDLTFAALADPTRRALLARLSESEAVSVSELAKPFAMSLPAVMKHLDVLKDAGLVAREKNGRVVSCRLNAGPMQEANEWLNRYQRFWSDRLDQLEALLEDELMDAATDIKPSLTIKRRFKAAPAKVFAAWTDPQKMMQWLGPQGVIRCVATNDLRVGGRYDIKMIMPDDEHNVGGVYREVVPNEKLVFTWAWRSTPERESLVTVTIKPDGGGSIMTLLHEQFFDEDARDRHNAGWTGTIDKLEQYLEG